jgi:energy-coupling factor transporter transmembrane protein EcfT
VIILVRILVLLAGLWLLLSFPKQMITIFALLILVIALAYYTAQSSRQRDPEQLEISAERSPEICTDANVPIRVQITNTAADRTVNSVGFWLRGYRPGTRSAAATQYLVIRKIIAPSESYSSCFAMPPYASLPIGVKLESLEWQAETANIDWR